MQDDYSDLDSLGHDFRPEQPFAGGLDTLPDGDYEFLIQSAGLGRTENGKRIFTLHLKTLPAGRQVDHTYWLDGQGAQNEVNKLGADLQALGLDVTGWGTNKPLSREVPAAAARLAGVRFRAHKSSRKKAQGDGHFHNLHIAGRAESRPGTATQPPPSQTPTANGPAAAAGKVPF